MLENVREQNEQLNVLLGVEEFMSSKNAKSSTKRSTHQPSDTMSMYGASSVQGSVMSNNPSLAKTAKALKYDSKMSKHEDRKLDRIAAEAQAFLEQNQKKELSDTSSVTSLSKGSVVAETIQSGGKLARRLKGTKSNASVNSGITGMSSFSKAGKGMANKFL